MVDKEILSLVNDTDNETSEKFFNFIAKAKELSIENCTTFHLAIRLVDSVFALGNQSFPVS